MGVMRWRSTWILTGVLVGLAVLDSRAAGAQTPVVAGGPGGGATATRVGATIVATADGILRSDQSLEIRLTRPLEARTERLAIVIGDADWSDLFTPTDAGAVYRPGALRLPVGDVQIDVYVVTPSNEWQRIASARQTVVTPLGFDRASVAPRLSVTNQGQVAERHEPDSNAPARATFQDVAGVIGLQTEHRRAGVTIETQTNFLAVNTRQQAARFGQLAADAPLVDLTDFIWRVRDARRTLTVGHGTEAVHRYLMPSLPTRGITFAARGARADVRGGAVSATNIVGYRNLIGVTEATNRLVFGQLGLELARRAGAARIEATALTGSRLSQAGFTQGQISDADRSRGLAARFAASDPRGRVRVDAGLATTRSEHPGDALLEQGLAVVPIADRSAKAGHLDVGADLVRLTTAAGLATTLTTTYRFERVDPFFRSVGAAQSVRSDVEQHVAETSVAVGGLTGLVSHTWSRDNVTDVPSILTSDSRLLSATLAVPSGGLRPAAAKPWWPSVSYGLTMSSQVGRGLPVNSGFTSTSHVPDQRNLTHTTRAEWSVRPWRVGYTFNRSLSDNRQPGRERADFLTLAHQFSLGASAVRADASVDVSREQSTAREFNELSRTTRLGGTLNWRVTPRHGIGGFASWSRANGTTSGVNTSTNLHAQYTLTLAFLTRRFTRPSLQIFGRSSWVWTDATSPFFLVPVERRGWTFNTGLSFSFQ